MVLYASSMSSHNIFNINKVEEMDLTTYHKRFLKRPKKVKWYNDDKCFEFIKL